VKPLLKKISEEYGLNLSLVEKVAQGFLSTNYVLTDGVTKYFLKKYRFTDSERIKEIHHAKKYFSGGDIPVILPIISKASDTFFEHEKGFYALFPFILDQQIEWDKLDEEAITSYAEMLARIHLLGSKSTISMSEFNKPWDSKATLLEIEQILQMISKMKIKTDFDIHAKKNLLLKKKLIESNRKGYDQFGLSNDHLIHGDYIIPNVFFDEDNNVSFVFDWEKTEYSSRFLELFRSMIQCTLFDPIRSKWYLDAYLALYPATKKNLEDGIDAYCIAQTHSLWIETEHYVKENTRADELLESNSFKINYFANKLESFKKNLFEGLD
jgi:Ser/Thr protein kinase RdoA (MazF antagonist)